MFKSYGSYDESLKIVSDWKFFLISIGLNETVVKYVDLEICHFDMSGLSNVNIKGRNEERNIVLKNELSLKTFNDYSRFSEIAKTVNNPRVQMLLKSEHSTLARKLNIKWFRLISILLKKKG
ncbi:hypothetical protein [Gelidibacter algens]|uniref:hypothetical protein n=1 Tax=Gelidibacter algens TaxID=49280 RepID=UPI000A065B04|nr:hypothetical protein [Gelidibacter algens]